MTFGEEVKRLRDVAGLKQDRLAAMAGVNQASISRIEGGERENVSPAVLFRLSDALGVPVDHWRTFFATPPAAATVGAGAGDAGEPAAPAAPVRVISKRK